MVQVVLDEKVILGMQLGLLVARRVVRTAIGEFHQALVADTDALAPVMAGITGLRRDSRIAQIADYNRRLARCLQPMGQQMSWLILVDGGIVALVAAFIAVGNVTSRATGAAIIAARLASGNPDVAALALLP